MTAASEITDKERSLLLLQQLVPSSGYSNIPLAFQAPSRIQWWPLQEAVNHLLRRQRALRTVFTAEGDSFGKRTLDEASVEVEMFAATEDDLSVQLDRFSSAPFPLRGEPLIRVGLFQCPAGDVVGLVLHHLVFDGSSVQPVLHELITLYNHLANEGTVPAALADAAPPFAERPPSAESERYWQEHLRGARPAAARIRCGRPDPAQPTLVGATVEQILPDTARTAASRLRRELRVTDNIVHLAAFYALLARHGAGDDLVVGTPIDMRTAGGAGSIGNHANTVALRVPVDLGRGFGELVRTVRDSFLGGLEHADLTVDSLVGILRPDQSEWRTTPCRYLFNYIPTKTSDEVIVDGEAARMLDVHNGHSRFDFEFRLLANADRLTITVTYSVEVHDEADIEALADRYAVLLSAAAASPDTPMRDLPVATERDRTLADRSTVDGKRPVIVDEHRRELPPGLAGELTFDGEAPTGQQARLGWDGAIELVSGPSVVPAVVDTGGPEPDPELVESLIALWRQMLKRQDLDADANFFTLGGQSLIAARLVYRASRLIGVRIPLNTLFTAPTPRLFARELTVMQARQAG